MPNVQEIEMDEETTEAVAEAVSKKLNLGEQIAEAVSKAADEFAARIESVNKKQVADAGDDDGEADGEEEGVKNPLDAETKEVRLFKMIQAKLSGDSEAFQKYQKHAIELRAKAGYANEGTDADGGYLVPDPEFDKTVYENLPKYGVAFKYADVRQTNSTAVKVLSLTSGLTFYATNEAGVKTSAKLQFNRKTVDLQKYAVIVPATDELTEDSVVDFWNLVTRELARAQAKKADEITFTDATYGITNTTGVITEPVSGAGSTITWDDMLSAEGAVEDDLDTSNFRWFMRKETWFRLVGLKGTTNDHYISGSLGDGWKANPNTPTTPWGTEVVFTRVLPKSSEVGANDAMAVYGDLSNYILYSKRGMQMKVLTEATIVDTESADFNLATQDGTAMRAVIRMLGVLPHANASKFVVLGTGTVS